MAADNFLWFPTPAKGGLLQGKATQPEGETTDEWFSKKKAFEIKDFSFGVENPTTIGSATGGAGAGKVRFNEFTVTKDVDLASIPLYNACTAGAHFPKVMLIIRKAGGSNLLYIQYIFNTVMLTKIDWASSEESYTENITFVYGSLGVQYIQQKADGTEGTKMQSMWSTLTNTPSLESGPDFLAGMQA